MMKAYHLKFYPYSDVVRYDNGKMELANDFKEEPLDMTPFIDKLIIEGNKSYPDECMEIIGKVKSFFSENSTNIYYLQRELYKQELSLKSAML